MNFITATFYSLLISFLLGLALPWWVFIFPCFIAGMFADVRAIKAFLIGFISIAALWGAYCSFITVTGNSKLPGQIAELFSIPNSAVLILVTALISGLVAGFASSAGHFLKMIIHR